MTKNEIVKKLRQKFKIYTQNDIALAVQVIMDSMAGALRDNDKIEIRGFGTFTARQRKSRVGRNPKTGAEVALSQRRIPFFKSAKDLRLKVDNKR